MFFSTQSLICFTFYSILFLLFSLYPLCVTRFQSDTKSQRKSSSCQLKPVASLSIKSWGEGGWKVRANFLESSENDSKKVSYLVPLRYYLVLTKYNKGTLQYYKGKYALRKIDLLLLMLELCRFILVLTRFWKKTKFQLEGAKWGLGGGCKAKSGGTIATLPYSK